MWDVRATMKGLIEVTQRYRAIVDQFKASDWVSQGAPSTYIRLREMVQTEVGYLHTVSSRLSANPEKLSLALDILFRLQSLETLTASLSEGAGRYQNQQLADDLRGLLAQNADTRTKIRQYVMDLSVTKEQEYDIAEKEAQRCQAELNRNPLAPPVRQSPVVAPRPPAPKPAPTPVPAAPAAKK